MIAPVLLDARHCLGVVQVLENASRPYTQDDLELLEVLAGQVAIALAHVNTVAVQRRQFDSFVRAITVAIDARNPCGEAHSLNVANYAAGIGHYLSLEQSELDLLHLAGLLHDVGKLHIPDRILTKPDLLNALEIETMKRHVEHTRAVLSSVQFEPALVDVARIAPLHHERLDGSGYPDALRGRDLDLLSRALCVADVFGALTQDRVHRAGMSVDEALLIVDSMTPHALDARCVTALRHFMGQAPEPPALVAAA